MAVPVRFYRSYVQHLSPLEVLYAHIIEKPKLPSIRVFILHTIHTLHRAVPSFASLEPKKKGVLFLADPVKELSIPATTCFTKKRGSLLHTPNLAETRSKGAISSYYLLRSLLKGKVP